MSQRIRDRFAQLKAQNRAAFIPFITAGDPDLATAQAIMTALPSHGADLIELGMPFSDPMAEGKPIQASSLRALQGGQTMPKTLDMVRSFRIQDTETPVILMGYFNPICAYGIEAFAHDAGKAGADGLIVVDLPPEEDAALRLASKAQGIAVIRLATPTSSPARLRAILDGADGFIYYVSLTGVTGAQAINPDVALARVKEIQSMTHLPVAVGFGIRTPQDAAQVAQIADAAVVGSAMVQVVANIRQDGDVHGNPVDDKTRENCVSAMQALSASLAAAVRRARLQG